MDEFQTVETEAVPEFQAPEASEPAKGFPSFRYGPDGQSAVFHSEKDVPDGWFDHPSKVKGAPDPSAAVSERRPGKAEMMKDLKRLGVPFNPMSAASDLHALLKAKQAEAEKPRASAPEAAPAPKAALKPDRPKSELQSLREAFKAATGKNPSPRATADQLKAAIAKAGN
jgi:hypothetical protein